MGTRRNRGFRASGIRFAAVGDEVAGPPGRADPIRIRSRRAARVARWFGLSKARPEDGVPKRMAHPPLEIAPGTITLIGGASGAGKSSLLRSLRRQLCRQREWIELEEIDLAEVPVVDCFGPMPLRAVLRLLGQVGLGEAWSYLRTPAELSDGQRWRLRVAIGLHAAAQSMAQGKHPVLACDEFAAALDRVTALVVARQLRGAIDALPQAAAVVATARQDLQPALRPETVAWCDFAGIEVAGSR